MLITDNYCNLLAGKNRLYRTAHKKCTEHKKNYVTQRTRNTQKQYTTVNLREKGIEIVTMYLLKSREDNKFNKKKKKQQIPSSNF